MKLETTLGIGSKEKDLEIQSLEILKTFHSQLEIQIHEKQIADICLYMVLTLRKLIALHINKEGQNNFKDANNCRCGDGCPWDLIIWEWLYNMCW